MDQIMQPEAPGDARVALLDVLVRSPRAASTPERHAFQCPIDGDLHARIEQRARQLGIAAQRLGQAALAILDSRLTGNSVVAISALQEPGAAIAFTIPPDAPLAAWLAALAACPDRPAAAGGCSAVGAWASNSTEATQALEQVPLAWWINPDAPAQLHATYLDPPLEAASVDMLAQGLVAVLRGLVATDITSLAAISPLRDEQRQRVLVDWNATAVARNPDDTVHGLFAAIAQAHPERRAIAWADGELDYATLDARADRFAASLRAAGVVAGAVVAVVLERSAAAIVALLGILKAGAAYLPLDPHHPPDRNGFAIADAGVAIAIASHDHTVALPPDCARVLFIEDLSDDDTPAEPAAVPAQVHGDARAYVMYTSGSTGTPKGVQIAHRAIIRLVRGVDYVDLQVGTAVLHAAPLGFDASTLEIWGPLLNGGVCVIHAGRIPRGADLAATIMRHQVRVAWLTAALFNAIVDDDPRHLAGLRQLLIGGEALSVDHVRRAQAALPDTEVINGYGPTECTTFSTTYSIPRTLAAATRSVPIGRPIADTRVYVLNARREPVPVGVIGELYIGGAGLALGYLARPELTSERFVADPFGAVDDRLYRTGDLVRWLPQGDIEFGGRVDSQVKIRGFRIETGEIEAALKRHPAIVACAVIAGDAPSGHKRLVAYFVANADAAPATTALREHLLALLPDFMVPAAFVQLDALPVTANGKLDQRALPAPDQRRPELAEPFEAPRNPNEAAWCALFTELLGLDRVGRRDNFFALGGNSLLAVQALARHQRDHSVDIAVATFFQEPTPCALAQAHGGAASGIGAGRLAHARRDAQSDPIAIVAMAGRFPGADDVEAFWDNLREGRETITRFARDELDPTIAPGLRNDPDYVAARGIVAGIEDFDAAFFGISPREAELTDPQQRVFLELCWDCLERGGHVPDAHAGPVGIFAGMYNASYFQHNVSAHPDRVAMLGAFQVMLGNEKDYIATRVAHHLDLTGPAVSVHTACSTSLVAIVQACDSLRGGHCDMALAGGIALTCPQRSGHLHQEGTMLSPDGHTRSFDAAAQGTVFSDGAAVVLLRRLDDALADGDPIYAVIRGGAINNDGARKASFTAPSSDGQAAVIAMALEAAQVSARSISYVEAHGTATALGDPIEIEGLTKAFRLDTDEAQFCAIGSLKSNVGHMVIAAGAAGVIKTALALSDRVLPPSLHFQAPNAQIDFAHSPFVVNRQLRPWPDAADPLRAGVSSFGVGGTNAHVILEEAPPREASSAAVGPQLLVLSARTPSALQRAAQRLADHLDARPPLNLADVAYTLIVGRKAFAQRACVVADDTASAVAKLSELAGKTAAAPIPASLREVVFMFPGQGAQYPGMGRALYASEPVFRAAFDDCARQAEACGLDLRACTFADDADALRETALTQPATFALEYALARLWISVGARPAALIGHSIGEFVAAVLAGVFSLADGMALVIARGRLMQAQPSGAMAAVRLDVDQLLARLPPGIALAAENAPRACVVAGEIAAVDAFLATLAADGIAGKRLRTSHAFHSAMMDGVLEPFRAVVRGIALHAPQIPIASTLTGAVLGADEAQSIDYWTRHVREPVRFSRALGGLLAGPERLLLEVGPRNTLSALARQHELQGRHSAVASLADTPQSERAMWLAAAGALWCGGVPIALDTFDRRPRRLRLRLPTYPFERKRHWLDAAPAAAIPTPSPATAAVAVAIAAPPVPEESMATVRVPATERPDRRARFIERLKVIFEDVSGVDLDAADVDANFIEFGLDSLSLTQVALQVHKSFALPITFRQLMETCPSLASLAAHLDLQLPADPEQAVAASEPSTQPAAVQPAAQAQVSAMPQTTPLPPLDPTANPLQQVIAQQMQIMQQQLALLAAAGAAPSVATGPAVPVAAAAVAAATPEPAVAMTPTSAAATDDEEAALAHTHYDVKKAFGAIARIHSNATQISDRQRLRLDAFMRRYIARTQRSKDYTQQHRAQLADPRVVNGFRPQLKEIIYQVVIERSKGSHVWDIDGNEYVDILNGFGMNLFGWQPDFVVEAIKRQIDAGYEIGPQHPLAGEVASLVCELTGLDRAAFCNTGSEAVMGTMRIARTITGRDLIVIFTGSYHGIFDEVLVRGTKKLRSIPAAPGILRNTAQNILVLDYGTPESLAIIRERADEIAAVLIEPVQSRRPDFQPRAFLRELREITRAAGALYIFDEVVTGFRSHPRGAQHVFDVDADLVTYGKVIGGGLPIGVIAGKRAYMDALDGGHWQFGDDSFPSVGVTYFAGTFVRHPLALAAAHAVLTHLRSAGPELQDGLNQRTSRFVGELNAFCAQVGAPIAIVHFSSVWKITFVEDHPLQDLLFAMLRSRGIHVLDNFPCFFTTAHSEADIARIGQAFRESVLELQESEFLPRRKHVEALALDASKPPVAGARLGKDVDGKPAWFIPNPQTPGKYIKVEA